MTSPTLLVMAAGMGSRYGGLKQMDPLGPSGETIIDYSLYDALRAGFGKVVFVIRKDIEETFRKIVGARLENRIAVEYAFQELENLPSGFTVPVGRTKPWGTAHAILAAAPVIREPFAAINADDFYGAESFRVQAQHLQAGTGDYAMVGFILRNTLSEFGSVARGVCRMDEDGFLQHVVELTAIEPDGQGAKNTDASGAVTRLTGNELVSMNMWGFTPHVFADLQESFTAFMGRSGPDLRSECYIPSVVNELAAAGRARVKVLQTGASWFGVTYQADRPRVVESINRLVQGGFYPEKLWL